MEKWALMLAQTAESEQTTDTTATETETTTTTPGEPGEPTEAPKPKGFFDGIGFPLILMLVVMYFLLFRGPKKKQQQHKQMLEGMKKNDRVRTIGGILGTVVDVRDNEVVLKVDETNNTKMHLARSAIAQIVTEPEEKK